MTNKCVHWTEEKSKCNRDGIGCKFRRPENGCKLNGQIEEKHDDFRLKPVDQIGPW